MALMVQLSPSLMARSDKPHLVQKVWAQMKSTPGAIRPSLMIIAINTMLYRHTIEEVSSEGWTVLECLVVNGSMGLMV